MAADPFPGRWRSRGLCVALFGSLAASGLVTGLRVVLIISVALAIAVVALATRIGSQTTS